MSGARLILTCGLPGAGKTTLARQLAAERGAGRSRRRALGSSAPPRYTGTGLAKTSQAAVSAYESGRWSPSVETLCRILAAAGFEVRMRLVEPDRHDATRAIAESLLPAEELDAFNERERRRVSRRRAGTTGAGR